MLYFCELNENTIVTHDGFFQLGVIHMSKDDFIKNAKIKYTEVYWIPDVVSNRYKTISYQNHLRAVKKLSDTP
jgi:hypothetical protein